MTDFDTVKKTMTLKDVKQMGTEGRRGGTGEIPPKEGLVTQIKFKVELIQEFNVDEEEQEEDPAILESSKDIIEERKPHKREDRGPWQRGTKVVKTKEQLEE